MVNGLVIAAAIIIAWFAFIIIVKRKKLLERYNITVYGPFLMWRTQGGKDVIEWLSRPARFWRVYAGISLVIVFVAMFSMFALLVWEVTLVPNIPAESAPSPVMLLGIPGVNPLIPIWYGILGLIVAIVVHEFAHGILTRVGKMAIKALGLIFAVVPMGAFVEPDEDALRTTSKKNRMRVYAVGPATNIMVAFLFVLIFSQAMVTQAAPIYEGPVIMNNVDDSPADLADLGYGCQILSIDGVNVTDLDSWANVTAPAAGSLVNVTYFLEGNIRSKEVFSGVALTSVSKGLPAYDSGMRSGMLMASLNDTLITNENDLKEALGLTLPFQTVNVTVLQWDAGSGDYLVLAGLTQVTLDSRKAYLEDNGFDVPSDYQDVGFLGINSAYLGAGVLEPETILLAMTNPYRNVESAGDFVTASLRYIAFPFIGLSPIQSPLADLFETTGYLAWMSIGTFWIIANCLYWIFWLNLMVGLTNALPAVPLDGGYLFKDAMGSVVAKLRKGLSEEARNRIVDQVSLALSFLILFLILWQVIGPRFN
jgi:membrane-associated protease RseP (regulator of RpoE activity)